MLLGWLAHVLLAMRMARDFNLGDQRVSTWDNQLEQLCVKWSSGCGQHVDIITPHMCTAGDKELGGAWERG